MAKILIVDDNAINRKLVVALLSYDGHVTLEASDGVDGLEVARAERPQLIISDILMPSMDGYEFVRQLRADSQLRGTPVIFHTAHYHEREARKLAEDCNVSRVLVKPCHAPDLLQAVEQVLAGVLESDAHTLASSFDREHLLLVTNKLAEKAESLAASNARFAAFTEIIAPLNSERDPHVLLEKVCAGARDLLDARYAVIAVKETRAELGRFFATSGINRSGTLLTPPVIDAGPLGEVVTEGRPWRICAADGQRAHAGLPDSYPPAGAFLAVPLASHSCNYGFLCLADKIGADDFNTEDERLLMVVGVQVGCMYENVSQYLKMQHREECLRQLAQARTTLLNRVCSDLGGIDPLLARARARGTAEQSWLDEAEMRWLHELAETAALALGQVDALTQAMVGSGD